MRGKKLKKSAEDTLLASNYSKTSTISTQLKIKFNLTQDSIACFIGLHPSGKKNRNKTTPSLKKGKLSASKKSSDKEKPLSKSKKEIQKNNMASCGDILKDALESILSEIEKNGIECSWKDEEESYQVVKQEEEDLNINNEIWSSFSVNQSFQKSHASTMDLQISKPYNPLESNQNRVVQESFDEGFRNYQSKSMFFVSPECLWSDPRTTLMIRNIPNKYTIKDLSEEIDYYLSNTYDFLYLPCDIKNQCNVGYGFINFISVDYLFEFYQLFHNHKWNKYRSEKVCVLCYARLQGLGSLIDHFENSKVLTQKEKKYRPIIKKNVNIEDLIKSQQLN